MSSKHFRLNEPPISLFGTGIVACVFVLSYFIVPHLIWRYRLSKFPHVRPRPDKNVRELINESLIKGFVMIGELDRQFVIPPDCLGDIKQNEALRSEEMHRKIYCTQLPGFSGFKPCTDPGDVTQSGHPPLLMQVIRNRLTRNLSSSPGAFYTVYHADLHLASITGALADETAWAFTTNWGKNQDWTSINLRESTLRSVAAVTSRVFLGRELCRSQEWLDLTTSYNTGVFIAARWARRIQLYFVAYLLAFLSPQCRALAHQVARAREIIAPVHAKRCEQLKAERKSGSSTEDAIMWAEELSRGQKYDPAELQMNMSMAAVHTTNDLLTQILVDLSDNKHMLAPMKAEVKAVLKQYGSWTKDAVASLHLIDSVMKETQRLKPPMMSTCSALHERISTITDTSAVTMNRYASEDVLLPNGIVVPKGTFTTAACSRMWDSSIYEDPYRWDGYRYYNLRKIAGNENWCRFVMTSPEHMAFGNGLHGCPGRFFAALEIKLIIAYLLLNYEFDVEKEESTAAVYHTVEHLTNPDARIRVKRVPDATQAFPTY